MQRRNFLKSVVAAAAAPAIATRLAMPAIAAPEKARTLRFVPQTDLAVLDPIFTPSPVTCNHGYYVFDTLFSSAMDNIPKPQMASGYTVSDDKRTWHVTLRDGLKFHDGEPVLARDCAASLDRWTVRDAFGQAMRDYVDKFGSLDDKTLEIRLKRPFPILLQAIGHADAQVPFIMPERIAKTDPNTQIKAADMIGSGPYRFKADEYQTGNLVVYEKFEGYVPRSEPVDWAVGGKIAYFPRIEWHIIPDDATANAALLSGEIDWWERPISDLLPALEANPDLVVERANPLGNMGQMTLNHFQPPFNNLRVRRALQMAFNQSDSLRAAMGNDQSLWQVCYSIFPCGTPLATLDDGTWMPHSIEKGKQELAASGYKGEKAVFLNATDQTVWRPMGLVSVDIMKRIGMNVELQETDWGSIVQRRPSHEPVEKGGWSAFIASGSSTNQMSPMTSILVKATGAKGWYGGWDNPEAVRLTDEWINATDEATREKYGHELARVAMSQVSCIPLGQFFTKWAYTRKITGVMPGVCPYPWNVRPA
jgi:peptide/nickel transport system substrate-binding protein